MSDARVAWGSVSVDGSTLIWS